MSDQIGTVVESGDRSATVTRTTRETQISVSLRLDGTGESKISTGVGFYDHLLCSLAHHALFDLEIEATGDLAIDEHHTVEDVALVLGAAFAQALGDRPYAVIDLPFKGKRAGKLPLQLIEHVFESFARAGGVTLHLKGRGRNDHHLAEAAFKALGRSLRAACAVDPRRNGVASTKGSLG